MEKSYNNESLFSDREIFRWHEQEKILYTQELHDTVLQEQIMMARALERLMKDYATLKSENIIDQFAKLYEQQQHIIYSIRQYCSQLRSPALLGENFEASIIRLIDGVHLQSNIEVNSHISANISCTQEIENHLYRIIQELLRNAMKHSEATELTLNLNIYHENIDLEYYDNGIGMEMTQEFMKKRVQHMGLSGLYYRTEILGGKLSIESELNQGVKVIIHIPNSIYIK
ncbi:sensor histidine kinase [Paenibacillus endoradicis]|uniref:sensor histidine kinase n=1 Tax=Paenibacillus endoradicis TaxID=2972487 RepID=UPI0021596BF7|nr:ATP-binding protein [Paenibacillus endoradicis]MCR8658812.1 ATP-binding protein [Paenibacillus endoradicis]